MKTFCTIITADYYPKAIALYLSLKEFDKDVLLYVLVTDGKLVTVDEPLYPGIRLLTNADLVSQPMADQLYRKYAHIEKDFYRWAAKPVLLIYLLEKGFTKILYCDCDLYFTGNYDFLFSELDKFAVLLTPSWRNMDPLKDEHNFISSFTCGMFNAGFIGLQPQGYEAMKWWAEACHYKMGAHKAEGIHDDQKYLDALPVYFKNIFIIRHLGCNVAPWNTDECSRMLIGSEVLINGIYPIIFIHFNHVLVREILKGHDPLLLTYLKNYEALYKKAGFSLNDFLADLPDLTHPPFIKKLKWQLQLRTRIKRFFYKLARSI